MSTSLQHLTQSWTVSKQAAVVLHVCCCIGCSMLLVGTVILTCTAELG